MRDMRHMRHIRGASFCLDLILRQDILRQDILRQRY